jgi:uncharacterized protein (TIGR02271 family)
MFETTDIRAFEGRDVIDQDGEKIGTIDQVYVDDTSGAPEFALVKSGLFGTKSRFVPVRDARAEGDDVRVPYPKDTVADAPSVDPDGHLSESEEAELYRYYNLEYSGAQSGSGIGDVGMRGTAEAPEHGRDDAMTRSEEELRVGTRQREAGKVRLRKYVTTEQVDETVPVKKERARVEREPITDANRDQALSGAEITEAEHEITLTDEEPVVEKRAVPKERVRLEKDVDTQESQVSEEVRKEQIEVDDQANRTQER